LHFKNMRWQLSGVPDVYRQYSPDRWSA